MKAKVNRVIKDLLEEGWTDYDFFLTGIKIGLLIALVIVTVVSLLI